uniref:SIS domain-containing protein n=1 Tax=viral metagenome TaxID=1070528 RepID=A0A6C0LYX2_9ZZZZ
MVVRCCEKNKFLKSHYITMIKSSILDQIKNEFNYQINSYNLESIKALSDEIVSLVSSNSVFITGIGKSGNIAQHCVSLLNCINIRSYYLNWVNTIHGDIGCLRKNDLVIIFSNSGNTGEILLNIPFIKKKDVKTILISCNRKSLLNKYCDRTIIIPFRKEIINGINLIPTNSCMSYIIFCNLLVSLLCQKTQIDINNYYDNHPKGNIGEQLKTLEDCLLEKYPIFTFSKHSQIRFLDILLEMTKFNCGCCIFLSEEKKIIGIILDGDIRRLILKEKNIVYIKKEYINTNFYYETDLKKRLIEVQKDLKYIPIIENKKIIGLCKVH